MNWDKVKNILIIILVLLNGFLFISMQESGAKRETDAKINEYVFTVLEERGITITCEVPDISGSTKIVHFGQAGFDKERVLSVLLDLEGPFEPTQTQFENNEKKVVFINPGFSHFYFTDSSKKTEQVLDIHQKSAVKKYVLDYLESIGVEWSDHIVYDYKVNEKEKTATILIYQKYVGSVLYDNFVRAIINETGFILIETAFSQINGIEISDQSSLLKPHQVLMKFFTEETIDSKVILIEEGIKKNTFWDPALSEEQAGLCWKIVTENGHEIYVSLMNGQEVK